MEKIKMEKLVIFCKEEGFIYQGSEIYGGLANTWDYGPLGTRLKNNLKDAWRKRFIQEKKNSYELDPSILMHPKVWEASGHVESFSDPLIDCKECKSRYRVDKLLTDFDENLIPDKMSNEEMMEFIIDNKLPCPKCKEHNFTNIRNFNLMFETYRGASDDNQMKIYLRPENAQGQYVNYLNVLRTQRAKLPFGVAQIGKAFRNEITPGNFTFRTIEFEQMEYQTYCRKGEDEAIYEKYKKEGRDFYLDLGIPEEKLIYHDHDKLAHYAKAACDIYYEFPWGFDEINGTHNRTDYDLKRHEEYSGVNHHYLDPETSERYIPYIVESTYGVDRSILALIHNAYTEEKVGDDVRVVMKLHPFLAPYKLAIYPLIKKHHSALANEIYADLSKHFMCMYDESGSIGKRYRRADSSGTPYVLTVDDNTLDSKTVTIRNRDSKEQITLDLSEVKDFIIDKIKF